VTVLSRLLPRQLDNTYQGYALALWLMVPIVAVKFLMGVNVAGLNPWINNRDVLRTVDGIPLDTFGAGAASTVVLLFASWGLALLLLSVLGIAALLRYRAMIPLMYLMLAIEQIGRTGFLRLNSTARAVEPGVVSPGTLINWGLAAALVIGLVLSLAAPRRGRESAES